MPEFVSVIIPAFNASNYLAEALDSVFAQADTQVALDVIVVDDGSTDDTGEVARRYDRHVRYFRLDHSGRPSVTRNHGLRHARADWIAFLDADDVWLPGGLQKHLSILRTRLEVGFTYGNYYTSQEGRRTLHFTEAMPPSGRIFEALFRSCFIHTSSVVVRRPLLEAAGGFLEAVHTAEDYWLWLQLAWRSEAAFVADPVCVKRLHPESISHGPLARTLQDLIAVTTSIAGEFSVQSSIARQRINPLRIWLAKTLFQERRYLAALRQLFLVLRSQAALRPAGALSLLRRHRGFGGTL